MGDRNHSTRFTEQTMENTTRHGVLDPTEMQDLELFVFLVGECHLQRKCRGIVFLFFLHINFLVHGNVELRVLFDFETLDMTKDSISFPWLILGKSECFSACKT